MNNNIAKITALLKKLRPGDFMYPGVFIIFFLIVSVIFFFAIQFISKNINKIFSHEQTDSSQVLDLQRYLLTVQKLNLIVTNQESSVTGEIAMEENQKAQPDIPMMATSTTLQDKSTLTLAIRNSTSRKGVAATLAKTLKDDGFAESTTGNEQKHYATTTIFLKESKRAYEQLILEAVRKDYPDALATTTPENARFDVTIIIGGNIRNE